MHAADGFFDRGKDNDRRRSTCADTALRAGAAAGSFMNVARCLAVVAGLFVLRGCLPMVGHVLVPCFMRFHILHLVHKHGGVARAAINGSLMVHAAFCCCYPGHAPHRQGHDKQEQEEYSERLTHVINVARQLSVLHTFCYIFPTLYTYRRQWS